MLIRVVAIDDHHVVLESIRVKLQREADIELVGTEVQGTGLLPLVRTTHPDVLILDLGLDGGHFDPILAVQQLRQEAPKVKVIVLTGDHNDLYMHALMQAGVKGYLLKDDALSLELPRTIRTVHSGYPFLSPLVANELLNNTTGAREKLEAFSEQELNILRLMSKGLSNDAIGAEIYLSGKTVANLLVDIYRKLNVAQETNKRIVAVETAQARKLIP